MLIGERLGRQDKEKKKEWGNMAEERSQIKVGSNKKGPKERRKTPATQKKNKTTAKWGGRK